ncbi:hypothetical protein LTSEWAN_2431 [Salmonella enterica subsp. enterica serovar Wandsworth str. A4-580]|uniref:Uncharacterized protein n=1 Tax=Salmonella enterica subsp. enterica serovar Wandsworth str. A4-580 TaxID=913086 RepID=G5SBB1_SALET|nr:hypothetical protein LTSEWAN_2431 [Salmonella enterica subsp. enterica serovar Wandsworth str. A4-580]
MNGALPRHYIAPELYDARCRAILRPRSIQAYALIRKV